MERVPVNRLVPIEEEAMRSPAPLVARSEFVMEENIGAVVKVEEAVERKPPRRPMVVEVETP
jgi:hypothetical protein